MEVNKQKSEAYKNLVKEMEHIYPLYKGTYPNDSTDGKVEFWRPCVKGNMICQEINLYTYWQGLGYARKTPHIEYLFVAQDWGSLFKTKYSNFIADIEAINNGNHNILYNDKSKTSSNLIELFKELGYDNIKKDDISKCRHDELFFTNFCLGYRTGPESGLGKDGFKISRKEFETEMMKSANLFRKLCNILEPEKILCLGQSTFINVYKALTGDEARKFDSRVEGKFHAFLDNHNQIIVRCGNVDTKVYPLAHCGGPGTAMRKLEIQKQDWKKIL